MAWKGVGPFTVALLSGLAAMLISVNPRGALTASPLSIPHKDSRFLTGFTLERNDVLREPATSTLREIIPAKYHKRYLRWRSDFLSTEPGRDQSVFCLGNCRGVARRERRCFKYEL